MLGFAAHHQQAWADGQRVDMAWEMSSLTLRIVVKTLFGLELPDDVRRIGEAFALGNRYVVARANQPPRLRRLLHRLPTPYTLRFKRAHARLDRMVYQLIEQRRNADDANDDLLSLLLQARFDDTDADDVAAEHDAPDGDAADRGQLMTDEQVRDQTITLFAAGHETTAVALTWTWYLLSTHPEIQDRFHAELDRVLGGRTPSLADPVQPHVHRPDSHRISATIPAHLVLVAHGVSAVRAGWLPDAGRSPVGRATTHRPARLPLVR